MAESKKANDEGVFLRYWMRNKCCMNFIPGEYISVKTRWLLIRVCAFIKQNDKASKIRSLGFNYFLM